MTKIFFLPNKQNLVKNKFCQFYDELCQKTLKILKMYGADPPPEQMVGDPRASSRSRDRAMSLPAALHFNQEIAQYSKQKQYDQACRVFEKMIESGVQPDVVTYNTMINVLVKSQRLSDAFGLFQQMKSYEISPTVVTYTSLIDGCGKSNNIFKALCLFQQAINKGIELNLHFFNAIINAALISDNLAVLDQVLAKMSSYGLEPNSVTNNTLLSGYYKMGMFNRLIDVIRRMIRNREEFTPTSTSTIFQSISLVKTKAELQTYTEVLYATGIVILKNNASQLIIELIANKRPLLAQSLMESFIERHIDFDRNILKLLLEQAGEFANVPLIDWICTTAKNFEIPLQLNSSHLNTYARYGHVSQVKSLICHHHISSFTGDSNASAVRCLLASGEYGQALALTESIINSGQLNATVADHLIQMFYEKNNLEKVLRIYQAVRRSILTISPHSADYVIHAYVKTKIDPEACAQLRPTVLGITVLAKHIPLEFVNRIPWVLMIESVEAPPPAATIFVLMVSLLQKELINPAWIAFKRFVSLGVIPSENTIELALQTQRDLKSYENISFILEAARHAGATPSSELCSAVIMSALNAENISEAVRRKNEPDIARATLNKETVELLERSLKQIYKTFPNIAKYQKEMKPKTNTRYRSQTVPKQPNANRWVSMEEISNRSAFLALDIDDL